ncbi:hypothetical protein [Chryseobacterium sp. OV279]|uniref:hypothetical protein n=1 Tax=Chryseobacterium sp. OV279 TaxID=1500285 RepID=UPI0009230554|nr:hypothetical protein [Chryseobacterium sp. OV279]SHF98294.1 hypothetical protein SAMN02787100_3167 [Chryseobacterium sp. OV279]
MFTHILKEPLTAEEKKKLKFVLKTRVIIGLIFIPILLPAFVLMGFAAIQDIMSGTPDGGTYFCIAMIFFCTFLLIRFVIPFYRNSFKNLKREDKLVVNTVILSISKNWTNKGFKYNIQTEYRSIDSWSVTMVIKPSLPYHEMYVNMPITIHCFEDNSIDILYIEKTDLKNR